MKLNIRRSAGTLAVACLALGLAACGSSSSGTGAGATAGAGNITIAGVYGLTGDPFWASLGCGAKEEAQKLGVTYKDYSSTSGDASAYSQSFSAATLAKPAGMFVNPSNPDQFVAQYKSLMTKGVPVVTINGTNPAAQYKVVGTDTKNLAFLDQLKSLVPTGSGKIAVINGIPGLVPVDSRLNPVVSAITSANPQLQALKTTYTSFDVNKATQAVSSLLIANPDLKVIVAADGPDGQATAAAVRAAGKAGKVTVIALDAVPAEVDALKQGLITALVAQSPKQIGADQLKALVDYIKSNPKGGAVPASDDFVGVPQRLLTKDNVGDAANADYTYQASC
ncbi:sugar ABC transporter substrate-binding protein [Nocardioides sp. DS6]|uniref:Sugar ABC transporter substrate-binding protein n=1 Tax=Nocardioides eburneus TaxID=3231482 RepID=A0ABV3T176_9ACTN